MTLAQWTEQIIRELTEAGFDVSNYRGFPLVKRPEGLQEGVRLIKFKTTMPADRTIYVEGMLFVPAGTERAAQVVLKLKTPPPTAADAAGE